MCGRYKGPKELAVYSGLLEPLRPFDLPQYKLDIRPTDMAPVFAKNRDGNITAQLMRWWLIPGFHHGAVKEWAGTTFNARIEEAATKPAYKAAWRLKHRVIIPAESYFEFTGAPGSKTPWEVTRSDGAPLAMAGLWDYAKTKDGNVLSFTMLTRAPGPKMTELHSREPVVLSPEQWRPWLDGADDLCLADPWTDDAFLVRAA